MTPRFGELVYRMLDQDSKMSLLTLEYDGELEVDVQVVVLTVRPKGEPPICFNRPMGLCRPGDATLQ